jgi:glycosyltransferase involved in cell wall biosynthesis
VYTEHASWDAYHPVTRIANRMTFGLNDACLAVSEQVRSSMTQHWAARTEVLVHGVPVAELQTLRATRPDARRLLKAPPSELVVGVVANFRPEKGHLDLLSAAELVRDRHDSVRFILVGQGPERSAIEAAVRERDLGAVVSILGFRADAVELMAGFDVFCLASHHEGLPVAIMEALALGLPIVSTNVGGVPAAVTDSVNGRLVRARDPRALADAIHEVCSDAQLRRAMARGSLERSRLFDAARAVDRLEGIYEARP